MPGVSRAARGAVPNQLVVKLAPHARPKSVEALHAGAGARVISEVPQLGIQTIKLPNASAAAAYRRSGLVLWAAPNHRRFPLVPDPDDPFFNQIDNDRVGVEYEWDAHLIDSVPGWTKWPNRYFTATGGKGADAVRIAVIDTGIDYAHPDFRNRGGAGSNITQGGQLARSLDRTIVNGIVTNDANDEHGHGTHVAGIAAAATNNTVGVSGVGYNAQVVSLRVTDAFGDATESDLAAAIVYAADNGVVICNISLGGYDYSQAEQDAVNYAWGKGMLVVAAAGNDQSSLFPNYPGALSRVLAVSATGRQDVLATYSNFGSWVGIAAPGGDLDTEPEFGFPVILGIFSTTPTYTVFLNGPDYGVLQNYDYLMGTSMASPQVTGLAALYAGKNGITQTTANGPRQIWQAIQRGAEGEGGWSQYYGYGRINIFDTLNLDTIPNPRGDTAGCFTGQVRYKDTAVQNAVVRAVPVGSGTTFSATSRADGTYRIANAQAGTYNLTATFFGDTQTLSGVVITGGCDMPAQDFNIGGAPPASYTVTASTNSVSAGAPISVSWTAPAGSSNSDWIGLYKTNTLNGAYLWWRYTAGAANGTFNLNAPTEPGDYEFRYLLNNGYTSVATSQRVTVTTGGSTYSVTPGATSVNRASPLSVSWTAPAGTYVKDWVALFRVGDPYTSYIWWIYTGGATSGTANLTSPGTAGTYEFRYFLNDGSTEVARSVPVTVN